jgi:hypothetical protein
MLFKNINVPILRSFKCRLFKKFSKFLYVASDFYIKIMLRTNSKMDGLLTDI